MATVVALDTGTLARANIWQGKAFTCFLRTPGHSPHRSRTAQYWLSLYYRHLYACTNVVESDGSQLIQRQVVAGSSPFSSHAIKVLARYRRRS